MPSTPEESHAESEGQGSGIPANMLDKQELLRQCQLKQYIDKLEEEVQIKEHSVTKFRLVPILASHTPHTKRRRDLVTVCRSIL